MALVQFFTVYGFSAAVIAIAALFCAAFTQRFAWLLSIIAAIAGGLAVVTLVAATIIERIIT